MAITAEQVRLLRETTGAGMMDCKRALEQAEGDKQKAIDLLREKGLASVAKRAGRTASEGIVSAYIGPEQRVGSLVEVNCESDFVARNEEFQGFVSTLAQAIVAEESLPGSGDAEALGDLNLANGKVRESLTALAAKIGEHLAIRRFARFAVPEGNGLVESYIHLGGKIGVLIELSCSKEACRHQDVANLARDLAMQVAASRPDYISRKDVPVEVVEKERAVYKAQAMNDGKPEQVAEKIVTGRLEKFYKEVCLLEQPFIKDQDRQCMQVMRSVGETVGASIGIERYARFERGEGS